MQNLPSSTLFNIARAGRWLFWTSLAYAAVQTFAIILTWEFGGRNYQPHTTREYIRWHFPSVFVVISLIAPLIPLYLFQFHLRKGCIHSDPERIDKGLHHLYGYVTTLAVVYGLKLVFEFGISQIW